MKIKFHKAYDSETNKLSLFIELELRIVVVPWARRFNDAAGRRQFAVDMLLRGCGLMRPLSDLKRMMPGSFGQIDDLVVVALLPIPSREKIAILCMCGLVVSFETLSLLIQ